MGNIKYRANIVRSKRESEFSEKKIVVYIPMLSGKFHLRFKLMSEYPFSFCDYKLVESIIITHEIAVNEVINIEYSGLTYYLFEYIENLVIAIYVAEMTSACWGKEITEMTISGIFDFFRELSNKHYEGKPPELSVSILPKKKRRKNSFDPISLNSDLLDTKKILALFKGHRHLLECDLTDHVKNVRTLKPYPDKLLFTKHPPIYLAPYEYQPTFDYSQKEKALVYILNRQGDIMVVLDGALILYRMQGVWRIFSAKNFVETVAACLSKLNPRESRNIIDTFAIYLGMLSFSLRNNRAGGLIVVGKRNDIEHLLPKDKYENKPSDTFYQNILGGKFLPQLPVSLLCNALSLDGATLIDIDGIIISFGAILSTRTYKSEKEGARTKAAEYASRFGIAIKISEDGPITIYRKSKKIFQLD